VLPYDSGLFGGRKCHLNEEDSRVFDRNIMTFKLHMQIKCNSLVYERKKIQHIQLPNVRFRKDIVCLFDCLIVSGATAPCG